MNAIEVGAESYLDIVGLSKLLNCSCSSIRRWVRMREFPQPIRLGRRVQRWRRRDVEQWLENRNEDLGL